VSADVLADDFYRAEKQGGAWFCVKGDDFYSAADYDTEEEAQEAADEMNGLYFADGRPANAAALASVQGGA
jgi:hypothetical protein